MVSKQNPEHGPTQLWAVVDAEDGELVMVEGRPAVFETHQAAERARKRTSRPARSEVREVKKLNLVARAVVGDRTDARPNAMREGE